MKTPFLLALCLFPVPLAFAQAAEPYTPHLAFGVISIREYHPGSGTTRYIDNIPHNSYYHAEGVSVRAMIMAAYQVKLVNLIESAPAWVRETLYTTTAKADPETDSLLAKLSNEDSAAEKRHMLQLLLSDRFHLKIHPETRIVTTYELVTTPRTSTFMTPVPGDVGKTISTCGQHFTKSIGIMIDSKGCPFSILLSTIQQQLGTDVLDHTGMTRAYAFHLMWKLPSAKDGEETYPDLEDAIPAQLGLELKRTKGPVTSWVIDHIEPPTPN